MHNGGLIVIMQNLCIIPARGGSKRFPKKNIALLNGKPLLNYSIEVASASKLFESVIVSTEDPDIKAVASEAGAVVHERVPELASDSVRIPEVCLDVIKYCEAQGERYDVFCLLQPTCPLRTVHDLTDSYWQFCDRDANYSISVCEYDDPPFWAMCEDKEGYLKFFWGEKYITVRQNLPRVFRHNGSIIWAKTEVFCREKEFMRGSRAIPYFMPVERSIDIDYPVNLRLAECVLKEEASSEDI